MSSIIRKTPEAATGNFENKNNYPKSSIGQTLKDQKINLDSSFRKRGMQWLNSAKRASNHADSLMSVSGEAFSYAGMMTPSGYPDLTISTNLMAPTMPVISITLADLGASRQVNVVTKYPHGYATNEKVFLAGGSPSQYAGQRAIVVTDEVSFNYNIGGAYPSAATLNSPTVARFAYFTPATSPAFRYTVDRDVVVVNGPNYTFGVVGIQAPPVKSLNSALAIEVEFDFNGKELELCIGAESFNTKNHRVWADGKLLTETAKGVPGANSYPDTNCQYIFAKAVKRKIRVKYFGRFFGTNTVNRNAIEPATAPVRPLAIIVGDSFVEGTGQFDEWNGLCDFIAEKMGWRVLNMGSGGTGITTGGTGRFPYIERIDSDIRRYKPDVVLVWGSVNDGGSITETNAGALLDALAAACPSAKLMTFGPCWPTESPQAINLSSATALKAASDQRFIPYIDGGIGLGGLPLWITAANKETYYNGTAATANSTVSAGALTAITLMTPGSGYDYKRLPVVTVSGGGGSGATAVVTLNTKVTDLVLLNGGSGYTTAPVVTLDNGATANAAFASYGGGFVIGVTVSDSGENYTTAPVVVFSGGGGTGVTAFAVMDGGRVIQVVLTAPGTGYTDAPTVTLVNSLTETPPTAVATVSGGVVTALTITNNGNNLVNSPRIKFSGGGGSGAEAVAYRSAIIDSVTVTAPGTGYTSAPTVTIAHPTGNDPTHPKTVGHQMLAARITSQILGIN